MLDAKTASKECSGHDGENATVSKQSVAETAKAYVELSELDLRSQ